MTFSLLGANDLISLLQAGDRILYGNRPDNLVPAVVVRGSEQGTTVSAVRVRLLKSYHTRRSIGGDSFYRAGAELTAQAARLWQDELTARQWTMQYFGTWGCDPI